MIPPMSAALQQLLAQIANPDPVSPFDEAYDLALANGLAADERRTLIGRLVDVAREGDGTRRPHAGVAAGCVAWPSERSNQ